MRVINELQRGLGVGSLLLSKGVAGSVQFLPERVMPRVPEAPATTCSGIPESERMDQPERYTPIATQYRQGGRIEARINVSFFEAVPAIGELQEEREKVAAMNRIGRAERRVPARAEL